MHPPKSVLVVDDEVSLLRLMVRVLERAGLALWSAQDGVEALRLFREHASEIDLVVIDVIHPPGAGAIDLLPMLLAESPDLDVILTSGDVLPQVLEETLASVGGQFLRKPFAPKALIAMIEGGGDRKAADSSNSLETKAGRDATPADSGAI